MLKAEDIKIVSQFGRVEWLLLSGIIATLSVLVFCAVLILQGM